MYLQARCDCGADHGRTRDKARADPGLVRIRRLEERYARDLRKIARQVGEIINAWAPTSGEFDLSKVPGLQAALAKYAEAIKPWAQASAGRIVEEVAIREKRNWAEQSKAMSRALRTELLHAPTGQAAQKLIAEQVLEITSIPHDAARRVYDLTLKGLEDSSRASSIVAEIMRSGEVAVSRANMIARTSVSTTASVLTQARSEYVGSTGYIWRTSKDSDVRPSHRRMEGVFVPWDKPPTIDGYTAHVGRYANCRCYPEPVLPDFD